MDTGNACVADPLDTAHHEMDHVIHGHHVYKFVWSPITTHAGVGAAGNPHNEFAGLRALT